MIKPIIDLHCDLLFYLLDPKSDPNNLEIGCAIPHLKQGNVKLQVMAIFAPTQKDSHKLGIQQAEIFRDLKINNTDLKALDKNEISDIVDAENIAMLASIENASAFCDEEISLEAGLMNFEKIRNDAGQILYMGLTHHAENRFGGGNYTSIGLKEDGKILLDYLNNERIAVDLSHTSDALAHDILNYISNKSLDIPIIASHSNYRAVFDHPRNLPEEIAKEIIQRQGLIGINFLRAFMNNENPSALFDHIEYALKIGAQNAISFGADYFYHQDHPDKSRIPFFFQEYENASCYQEVITKVENNLVQIFLIK